ncbi:MAG: hypothetical protein HKN10_12135 [Myxococcales bacterium]|nr:hypothetical protein [Myxococcales bacterium]
MSNLTAIAMIAAITIAGYFVFLGAERWTHERGDALATGLLRGVPMSAKHRWLLLFNNWLPNALGTTTFSLAIALALVAVAREVNDPFIGFVAYLCAIGFGMGFAFWLLLGTSWLVFYVSLLRETKTN